MILDKLNLFCDAQEETTVATHASTNDVDLVVAGDAEKELYFVVKVNTAFTSGGAATLQVKLITDSDVAFGSAVDVFDSGAIALATLVQGYNIVTMRLPKNIIERYMRVQLIIGTAVMTAGAIDAYLTPVVDNGLV